MGQHPNIAFRNQEVFPFVQYWGMPILLKSSRLLKVVSDGWDLSRAVGKAPWGIAA